MVNAIGSAVLIFAVWTGNIVFGRIGYLGTANLARAVATVNYQLRPASETEPSPLSGCSEGAPSRCYSYWIGGFNISLLLF